MDELLWVLLQCFYHITKPILLVVVMMEVTIKDAQVVQQHMMRLVDVLRVDLRASHGSGPLIDFMHLWKSADGRCITVWRGLP